MTLNGVRYAGVHLDPRGIGPSAVAALDAAGALVAMLVGRTDAEVLTALPAVSAIVAVDAPLAIPNESGRRDLEQVLAWCDVNLFPVSGRRMTSVFGGARGVTLAPALAGRTAFLTEFAPSLVLRELLWERDHPVTDPPLDLADYRRLWLSARPPAHAPTRRGTVDVAGLRAAADLLAGVIDPSGWTPDGGGDPLADAARVGALAGGYAALRCARPELGPTLRLGDAVRGQIITPADANLVARVGLHVERLRAAGEIAI